MQITGELALSVRCPTRRLEKMPQGIHERTRRLNVPAQSNPLMEGCLDRIVRIQLMADAIHDLFIFNFIGTEEPIPDDERPAVIAIALLMV